MSDAPSAPSPESSELPHSTARSIELCNIVLDAVNAQGIPLKERAVLLDGMLLAYMSMAHAVGLADLAARVMIEEGMRITRNLLSQAAQAAQAQREAAGAAEGVDPQAVMDAISASAKAPNLH